MGGRDEDEAEATGRPWHISLQTAAEVRAVAALSIAALEPRHRQPVVSVQLAAEGIERDAGSPREVIQVLGDRVLVEQDRDDRPAGAVPHR